MTSQQRFEITPSEWRQINEFCEHGQTITKPSSFGYHTRKLTIQNNDTIAWQSKSLPLCNIHSIAIGSPPKKLFRKMDPSKTSLWITIQSKEKSVSLLYDDIKSRNFWIKSITLYMSKLTKPLYIKSMQELQSALDLGHDSKYTTTTIHYSSNGKLRPFFSEQQMISNIEIPKITESQLNEIDVVDTDDTQSGSTANTIINSTDDVNVDYATVLQKRELDAFRNTASANHIPPITKAMSIKSDYTTDDITSFSAYSHTLSSNQQYNSLSNQSKLIDVEIIDYIPKINQINKNSTKLFVLTNDNGNIKSCHYLKNVCIINITLLTPTNDEETNIQMIETELDEIYSKLYSKSNNDCFQCLVLPKLEYFATNLQSSSPEIFDYLQRKFEWIINQIKSKNGQYLSNGKITPASTKPIVSPSFNVNATPSLKDRQTTNASTLTQSISHSIVPGTISKKILNRLGVDPLTKLTTTLMKNGEKFKMYYPSGSSIFCKIFLNAENNGLIGDDLAIGFKNIIALYGGKYDKYPNANPSASFMIEYKLDDIDTKCILLEIIHSERYHSRRNWWINSIISCIAYNEPFRVPPSISSITKILSSITDDSNIFKLTFVDINDIEESFSISFDSSDRSNDTNHITNDVELARKKALQRVRKYKKLQKDIENMTKKSKFKQEKKINEINTCINIDTIPFENEISPKNELPINESPINESPINESIDNNSIQFATNEDTVKMRSKILNLTRKLQYMEKIQMTQSDKMQKFIEKESMAIKRYENEIKRLKKENKKLYHENKQFEIKINNVSQTKIEIEKEIKLKEWNKTKNEQSKNKKLKITISQMSQDMESLYDKLEKKENGYNAAIQNYNREKRQKEKLEREYKELENRYICDTQQIKDELLQLTQINHEIKRHSKKMRKSLSYSEENEHKFQKLLKNEIERSKGLEKQIIIFKQQLNDSRKYQEKFESAQNQLKSKENESKRISQSIKLFNDINGINQEIKRENESLKIQIIDLQNQCKLRESKLNENKQEIKRLNIKIEELGVKMKDKERIYQQKLIDFTKYAQQQMTVQQQSMMDKMNQNQ